jgi:S1-C subfamily serine protease
VIQLKLTLMKILPVTLAGIALVVLAQTSPAQTDDAAAMRKILAAHQDSVVRVSTVLKGSAPSTRRIGNMTFMTKGTSGKQTGYGTVVDANGLVVTSLTTLDGGLESRNAGQDDSTPEMKELKIITANGTEIPAELVLKDADLDLAFLRPQAGAKEAEGVTFSHIDLNKSATLNVAELAVTISRGDEVLNHQALVDSGTVTTVLARPRTYFRVGSAAPGCPTFTRDGKLVGIGTHRYLKGRGALVVMPATDVLELAKLANQSGKAPEKKAAE